MTIATVSQPGADIRIELLDRSGSRVLIATQAGAKTRLLLDGKSTPIPPGIKGYEQCIRFVVDHYGRSGKNLRLEFDLSEVKNPQDRKRLQGMAGGILGSAGMTREQRKERAMKAAGARYSPPPSVMEIAITGGWLKWEYTDVGSREWAAVTTVMFNGKPWRQEKVLHSRRELEQSRDNARLIAEFLEYTSKETSSQAPQEGSDEA